MTTTNPKTSHSSSTKPGFFYGYIVVAAAFIIMVLAIGAYFSFGVFFKPMMTEFGWTRATTSGAFSLSWIISGLISIPLGRLNDKFGPRLVVTICSLLLALGYFLISQISTIWQLYLFYGVIIGIGISSFVPLVSTLAKWFIHRRTLITGVVLSGVGIGALIGPIVADRLIQTCGWRDSFIILGITILVFAVSVSQFLRSDPSQVGQQPYRKKLETTTDTHVETKSFSLKEALCTWQFWIMFVMFACFGYINLAILVHLVPYITDMGISTAIAAGILAIVGGASIVGRIFLGSLGDRIGNKNASAIGFTLMLLCMILLVFSTDVWTLYLFAILFGIGYGDCAVQETPLVAAAFGLNSLGLIFAFAVLGFTIGAAIGPFVSGYIFDVTKSYHIAFLASIFICAIGLILNMSLKPIKTKS